jgi:dolichol-phosphate mannosyltransferase
VVLPTYNEIESLSGVLARIRRAVPEADVVVVDDSSPDGTGALAERLAADDPQLAVIHRATKDGLGRAYLAGFDRALSNGYRFVVEIDADGSHDPAELPAMIDLARAGADLVIGSRWVDGGAVRNWPWFRRVISRTGNRYARLMLHSQIRDITAGFRVYATSALRSLDLGAVSAHGYGFQVELAWMIERAGLTVVEHPITFVERAAGTSKMGTGIVVEALVKVTIWGWNSRRPGAQKSRPSLR